MNGDKRSLLISGSVVRALRTKTHGFRNHADQSDNRRPRSPLENPASVDPTEARYGRMLNKNQTTANQCVGALLTGHGDWTATELSLAAFQGWEAAVRRRMTGEMPAK
jgi:hypothetical protein